MTVTNKTNLWAFACGFYEADTIKQRCLDLQEVYDANVDVILWLCWLDANRVHLAPDALQQALDIVGGGNQQMLHGLRDLRAQLSSSGSFTRVQEQLVRKHLLAAELAIEKVLLQRLQDLTSRLPEVGPEDESLSLFDYLGQFAMEAPGQVSAFFLEEARQFHQTLAAREREAV